MKERCIFKIIVAFIYDDLLPNKTSKKLLQSTFARRNLFAILCNKIATGPVVHTYTVITKVTHREAATRYTVSPSVRTVGTGYSFSESFKLTLIGWKSEQEGKITLAWNTNRSGAYLSFW